MYRVLLVACSALALFGCASVIPGSAEMAAVARQVRPAENATAVYFCRAWAFAGGGVSLFPSVDGRVAAILATNTFTRIDLSPGEHEISLAFHDEGSNPLFRTKTKKMESINAKAGDVYFYWIGVTGTSLGGVITIDRFDNKQQAVECIESATYVSPRM